MCCKEKFIGRSSKEDARGVLNGRVNESKDEVVGFGGLYGEKKRRLSHFPWVEESRNIYIKNKKSLCLKRTGRVITIFRQAGLAI